MEFRALQVHLDSRIHLWTLLRRGQLEFRVHKDTVFRTKGT